VRPAYGANAPWLRLWVGQVSRAPDQEKCTEIGVALNVDARHTQMQLIGIAEQQLAAGQEA